MSDEPKFCHECGARLERVRAHGFDPATRRPLTRLRCPERKNCNCHGHYHEYEYPAFRSPRCKLCKEPPADWGY